MLTREQIKSEKRLLIDEILYFMFYMDSLDQFQDETQESKVERIRLFLQNKLKDI